MNKLKSVSSRRRVVVLTLAIAVVLSGLALLAYGTLAETGPKLYMQQRVGGSPSHSTIEVEIRLETAGNNVNAVQADVEYPTDILSFVNIEAYDSAFEIEAEATEEDGIVRIARGSASNVKGGVLVATVSFEVIDSSGGAVELSFADSSMVVHSSDHKDILSVAKSAKFDTDTAKHSESEH